MSRASSTPWAEARWSEPCHWPNPLPGCSLFQSRSLDPRACTPPGRRLVQPAVTISPRPPWWWALGCSCRRRRTATTTWLWSWAEWCFHYSRSKWSSMRALCRSCFPAWREERNKQDSWTRLDCMSTVFSKTQQHGISHGSIYHLASWQSPHLSLLIALICGEICLSKTLTLKSF